MKTKLTILLLACGAVAASPLASSAQEGPPPANKETIKPAEPTAPGGQHRPDGEHRRDGDHRGDSERAKHDAGGKPGEHRGDREHAEHRNSPRDEHRGRPEAPKPKPVPYLGLATHGLSPEVAAQAGLPQGFGLMVEDVMEGSPAKEAGVQKYDVIVLLGDQRIVNLEQFQALVRSQKKGDEVTLTIRRKGQETKITAKLGEHVFAAAPGGHPHPMLPPHARGSGPGPRFFHHRFPGPDGGARFGAGDMKERAEHLRQMMRERFEQRMNGKGRDSRDGGPHPGPGGARSGTGDVRERAEHFREMMRERFQNRRDGEAGPGGEHARGPMPPRFGHGPMMPGRFGPPAAGPMAGEHHRDGAPGPRGPGGPAEKHEGNPPGPGARSQGSHPDRPPGGPRPDAGPRHEGGPAPDGPQPGAPQGARREDGPPGAPKTRA
ncbi:MAG: PDZ domain-containing protein [Verrucomicrobiaceae bacterium]|nr:PDZ domain-containing protein [Verrucomicrobiaceae bacterium]